MPTLRGVPCPGLRHPRVRPGRHGARTCPLRAARTPFYPWKPITLHIVAVSRRAFSCYQFGLLSFRNGAYFDNHFFLILFDQSRTVDEAEATKCSSECKRFFRKCRLLIFQDFTVRVYNLTFFPWKFPLLWPKSDIEHRLLKIERSNLLFVLY